MFAYPDYYIYEPRNYSPFHPRTRNFPCSYYYNGNNRNPFYSQPEPFYYSIPRNYSYDDDDDYEEEDQRERLLRERLNRKKSYRQQQEEHERDYDRLKGFYETQPNASTFTSNYQPKKSFKVKVQGGDDEKKSTINKSQAAQKIFNFIKNQSANKLTRKILNKLYTLGKIENELKEVPETKNFGNLTFNEENGKRVLPISIENKRFLEYEDKIVKLLDKLDRVQSEGVDIIRERRKFIVKFAQTLLDELDNEKENQWKIFSETLATNEDTPIIEETDVPISVSENEGNVSIIEETDVPISVSDNEGNASVIEETDVPMSVSENEGNEPIIFQESDLGENEGNEPVIL